MALHTYQSVQMWREAESGLNAGAFTKFCARQPKLTKFMQDVWDLIDNDEQDPD